MTTRSFLYTLQEAVFRVTVREDEQRTVLSTLNGRESTLLSVPGDFKGVLVTPFDDGLVMGLLTYDGEDYHAGVIMETPTGQHHTQWRFILNTLGQRAHDENGLALLYHGEKGAIILEGVNYPNLPVAAVESVPLQDSEEIAS
jgi:hypothetical protein